MDFIPVLDTYSTDVEAQHLWERLEAVLGASDGIAFYKHPTLGSPSAVMAPDFVVVARGFEPFVARVVRQQIVMLASAIDAERRRNARR